MRPAQEVGPAGRHPVPSRPSCPAVRRSAVSGLFQLFPFDRCFHPLQPDRSLERPPWLGAGRERTMR